MKWLKNVLVDIGVTLVILLTTAGVLPAGAEWVIYVYTPFRLLLKIVSLSSGVKQVKQQQKDEAQPPEWFFHVLYAVNVIVLLYSRWWWTGAQWALIWGLSMLIERRK
jgi:hypothetical protein